MCFTNEKRTKIGEGKVELQLGAKIQQKVSINDNDEQIGNVLVNVNFKKGS